MRKQWMILLSLSSAKKAARKEARQVHESACSQMKVEKEEAILPNVFGANCEIPPVVSSAFNMKAIESIGPYRLRTNHDNQLQNSELAKHDLEGGTKSGTVSPTPLLELLVSWSSLPDSIQRGIISAVQEILDGVSNG